MTDQRSTTRKRRFNGRIVLSLVLAAMMISLTSAEFLPVNNGSFGGEGIADVEYINVTQNSQTDPITMPGDPGPYGQPELMGNQLSFNAPSFAAIANPDRTHDLTDGFLGFGLRAVDGFAITHLGLYEFGAIQMFSGSGGSMQTWTSVAAPVFVEVTEVVLGDGSVVAVPGVMFTSTQIAVSPDGASPPGWNSLDDPAVTQWTGALGLDLLAEIATHFPDFANQNDIVGVNRLSLTMNNILAAAVEPNASFSFLDKKHTDVRPTVVVVDVPEPATFTLLSVLALGACGSLRRLI